MAGLWLMAIVGLVGITNILQAAQGTPSIAEGKRLVASKSSVDQQQAFEIFQSLSRKGNIEAHIELGLCYLDGIGVSKDDTKAFELFKKAADAKDGRGLSLLGNMYHFGRGVKAESTKAFDLYRQSAATGNLTGQTNLARCYLEGKGVTKLGQRRRTSPGSGSQKSRRRHGHAGRCTCR